MNYSFFAFPKLLYLLVILTFVFRILFVIVILFQLIDTNILTSQIIDLPF